jgi:polyferredoxin
MPETRLSPRLKTLRTLGTKPHPFRRIRVATQALTLAIVYAIPLLGLVRFDMWDGRHRIFGHATNSTYGFGGLILGIAFFYIVTFVINAFAGRVFCGFGCPIGQASRFGEEVEIATKSGKGRLLAELSAVLFALALGTAGFLWFASPRVFVEGTPRAMVIAAGGLLALAGVVYAHGRYVRWTFCKSYCPIGIYYSAVQTAHGFGIHFDNSACKGCDVCTLACPVGLTPRDLEVPINGLPGIGLDGFPSRNHCLTCGDCVRACEHVTHGKIETAPLRLGFSGKADKDGKRHLPVQP